VVNSLLCQRRIVLVPKKIACITATAKRASSITKKRMNCPTAQDEHQLQIEGCVWMRRLGGFLAVFTSLLVLLFGVCSFFGTKLNRLLSFFLRKSLWFSYLVIALLNTGTAMAIMTTPNTINTDSSVAICGIPAPRTITFLKESAA